MVFLGAVEGRRRLDGGDDRPAEALRRCERGDGGLCLRLLLARVDEDHRTVLGAEVRSLAVEGGGIMVGEEDFEQPPIGDALRVEGDLHHLGMAGVAAAHIMVARLGEGAAGVADGGVAHPGQGAEDRLDAPEAAGTEGRDGAHGLAAVEAGTKVRVMALMQ